MALTQSPSSPAEGGVPEGRRGLPRWKKVFLTVAAFFLLSGAGLKAYGWFRGGAEPGASAQKVVTDQRNLTGGAAGKGSLKAGSEPGGGHSLVGERALVGEKALVGDRSLMGEKGTIPREGAPPFDGDAEEKTTAIHDWSPTLLKGGMSFFFGFCIGYAIRQFFRVSAVLIGLVLLALFGLSYAGVIAPLDWTAIQAHFDRLVATLREEGGQFKTFITGNLPSAGMAGAGLFTGFKRN